MKKIILIILCLATISICVEARGRNREPYKPKSEITVRWGVVDDDFFDWDNDDYYYALDSYYKSPLDRYNAGQYYKGDMVYIGAVSLSYTNELKRWLAISINGTYYEKYQHLFESETRHIVSTYRKSRVSVVPMVRFTYLNRPIIRLYSAVGLGLGIEKENDDYETQITGQMTFFGVSVGKKLFGLWEFGYGSMGYFTIGGGYRF